MNRSDRNSKHPFACIVFASLELIRPANIITAFADILGGIFIVQGISEFSGNVFLIPKSEVFLLLLATFGLYGGGIAFNDVFDAELDKWERPERPIPEGRVSRTGAGIFASFLISTGILSGYLVNLTAGTVALSVAICTFIYNSKAKRHLFLGPIFMGMCRAGNLLLGCSLIPGLLSEVWQLSLIPLLYIGSITLLSKGEVHGGKQIYGWINLGSAGLVMCVFLFLPLLNNSFHLLLSLPFLIFFLLSVFPPFLKAARQPAPGHIRTAIKRGVISLVLVNSIFTAGFSGFMNGLIVFSLFFVSVVISKTFRVS